jgi:FkbM family methyltransferase
MRWIDTKHYADTEFFAWVGELLHYIKQENPGPHTWIDIGAHQGDITKLMLNYSTEHDVIHAFEPNYYRYKKLCKKFQHNKNLVVWPLAVNDSIKTTEFFVPIFKFLDGGSFLTASPFGIEKYICAKNPTTTVPLDFLNWPDTPRINFIKIDAETNDFLIMQGAQNTINKHRPIILFEFSGCIAGDAHGYTPETWYEFFQKNNYHLRVPFGGHDDNYVINYYSQPALELHNLLAVPNESPLPF